MIDILKLFDLQRFATPNTLTTATSGLTDEMKTMYVDELLELAEPKLVYNRYGKPTTIKHGQGKKAEWRIYAALPVITTALTEGVTPDGQSMSMSVLDATVLQYGGYVTLSDLLKMTAIDDNQVQALKALASQAGRSVDTLTRDVVLAGTNVYYCPTVSGGTETAVTVRYNLDETAPLDYDTLVKAKTYLENHDIDPLEDGMYVCIVHPSVAMDIMNWAEWKNARIYTDPSDILKGVLGELNGIKFVKSSRAKMWKGTALSAGAATLTCKSTVGAGSESATIAIDEVLTTADATALAGRTILVNDIEYEVESASAAAAGSATITIDTAIVQTDGNKIYAGGAGKLNKTVYGSLLLGADAYGVVKLSEGSLQYIVKQLGSGDDPLDQRATCGWKVSHVAKILNQDAMVRIESGSTQFYAEAAN